MRQGYKSQINLKGGTTFGQSKRRRMNANRALSQVIQITVMV